LRSCNFRLSVPRSRPMRPRWLSSGDGRPTCTRRAAAKRRTAVAELLGSRGMRRSRRGRRLAKPLQGQGRPGARPASKRGRRGGCGHSDPRRDRRRSHVARCSRTPGSTAPQHYHGDHVTRRGRAPTPGRAPPAGAGGLGASWCSLALPSLHQTGFHRANRRSRRRPPHTAAEPRSQGTQVTFRLLPSRPAPQKKKLSCNME